MKYEVLSSKIDWFIKQRFTDDAGWKTTPLVFQAFTIPEGATSALSAVDFRENFTYPGVATKTMTYHPTDRASVKLSQNWTPRKLHGTAVFKASLFTDTNSGDLDQFVLYVANADRSYGSGNATASFKFDIQIKMSFKVRLSESRGIDLDFYSQAPITGTTGLSKEEILAEQANEPLYKRLRLSERKRVELAEARSVRQLPAVVPSFEAAEADHNDGKEAPDSVSEGGQSGGGEFMECSPVCCPDCGCDGTCREDSSEGDGVRTSGDGSTA